MKIFLISPHKKETSILNDNIPNWFAIFCYKKFHEILQLIPVGFHSKTKSNLNKPMNNITDKYPFVPRTQTGISQKNKLTPLNQG